MDAVDPAIVVDPESYTRLVYDSLIDVLPDLTYRPGLDNVENLTSVFYSERVKEHRPFQPEPAEVLSLAWIPLEDCVSLILEQRIVDALTISAVLAYRCVVARRGKDDGRPAPRS